MKIAEYILSNYSSTRELGVLLTFLTGLSIGELAALKVSDQEKDMLYIRRTEVKYKNEQRKTVYVVREFPKSECSMNGIELSDSAMKVLSIIRKLNMKNGVEEKIAQSQLRHKDSATTHKHYEFSIRNREYKRAALHKNDILQQSHVM